MGYMMLTCAKNIRSVLYSISNVKLKQIINECYNQNTVRSCNKNVTSAVSIKLKLLKKLTITEFMNIGRQHLFFAFNYYLKMSKRSYDINCNSACCKKQHDLFQLHAATDLWFIVANVFASISGQHKNSIICYVLSIVSSMSQCGLYEQVLYLRALSKHCYLNKEYFIGYKILKCAFKLSKGYILPSFVNIEYNLKRKKFKQKRRRMKCFNCNKTASKLYSCKGCMKAVYCYKKCQKKHWNTHC
eukprot:533034_1